MVNIKKNLRRKPRDQFHTITMKLNVILILLFYVIILNVFKYAEGKFFTTLAQISQRTTRQRFVYIKQPNYHNMMTILLLFNGLVA